VHSQGTRGLLWSRGPPGTPYKLYINTASPSTLVKGKSGCRRGPGAHARPRHSVGASVKPRAQGLLAILRSQEIRFGSVGNAWERLNSHGGPRESTGRPEKRGEQGARRAAVGGGRHRQGRRAGDIPTFGLPTLAARQGSARKLAAFARDVLQLCHRALTRMSQRATMGRGKKRFVAYYRVSTQKQGRSGLGIEAQREAVARYLDGGAWQIIAEFTEVESGRRKDRPELDRALAAARLHRAPLVVAKVDRLTRSVSFLSRLLEAGVDVRFADLPSIEGPTGRFMLQQMASVAELEAGLISSRTKAALAAAKARGKKLGGNRGVVLSDAARASGRELQTARANERAADLRPVLRELQRHGITSLRGMASALNQRNIPTARGRGAWSAVQVARVLNRT
jgi:DNA invertase Pin-like site-specific DNA recombinase